MDTIRVVVFLVGALVAALSLGAGAVRYTSAQPGFWWWLWGWCFGVLLMLGAHGWPAGL